MKLSILSVLLAIFASAVLGLAPQKAVVVTYPSDTPEGVITQAKDAVRAAVCLLKALKVLKSPS